MSANVKVKCFPGFNSYTVCNFPIFDRPKRENKNKSLTKGSAFLSSDLSEDLDDIEFIENYCPFSENPFESLSSLKSQPLPKKKVRTDSTKRSRDKAIEIAFSNNFTHFVTLTLNKDLVNRYDATIVSKKLKTWLNNQVKRYDLKYLLFPEYHKDGAIHIHGLMSGNYRLVDSGTVLCKGFNKPMLTTTALEKGVYGITVYNLDNWTLGFSTAIEIYGDYSAAVWYCMKYITKDNNKIFGNYYYSGGLINRSVPCTYGVVDYDSFPGDSVYVPTTCLSFKYFIERDEDSFTDLNNSILKDVIFYL